MDKDFITDDVLLGSRVVLRTPGRYSMDAAVRVLRWLEQYEDCEIDDSGWKSPGYGRLVEEGIHVRVGSIELQIMCSHEHIYIDRISGNKRKFIVICDDIQGMKFKEN